MDTQFTEAEQELLQLLDNNPDFRAAIRRQLLTTELLELPQRVAEVTQVVANLAAQIHTFTEETNRRLAILEEQAIETNRRLAILEEQAIETNRRLAILETDVAVLKTDVATLKADVATLKTDVATLKTDVSALQGSDLERRARRNILNIARDELNLTRGKILLATGRETDPALLQIIERAEEQGRISEQQVDHVLVTDIIIRARRTTDRQYVHAILEVSQTIRQDDIQRAYDRAATVAAATGEATVAAVIGATIDPRQRDQAERLNVRVITPAPPQPEPAD